MWALGINTGLLDCSNLCWRLAWRLRGWAGDEILDAYEREQKPVAAFGAREMAEAARRYMAKESDEVSRILEDAWGNACTRSMLGVRLDIDGRGEWSMVKYAREPAVQSGDRIPDWPLHDAQGEERRVHDLNTHGFAALHFTDARRRPTLPPDRPGLNHYVISRWDAPFDSLSRDRALFDPGGTFTRRVGCAPDTVVMVRPDDHVAGMAPVSSDTAELLYARAVGKPPPGSLSYDQLPPERR
jgi:3-(3-hydroxy-phenyl)propionate hydroxylase